MKLTYLMLEYQECGSEIQGIFFLVLPNPFYYYVSS